MSSATDVTKSWWRWGMLHQDGPQSPGGAAYVIFSHPLSPFLRVLTLHHEARRRETAHKGRPRRRGHRGVHCPSPSYSSAHVDKEIHDPQDFQKADESTLARRPYAIPTPFIVAANRVSEYAPCPSAPWLLQGHRLSMDCHQF